MTLRPGLRRALVPAILLAVLSAAAPAFAAEPTLRASSSRAKPGDVIQVTLEGWPSAATVTVCGNAAARGAVDCDQIGGVGFGASTDRPWVRDFLVTAPPARCPCVIRAATAGELIVKTVPIDIVGVGTAPVVSPDLTSETLAVTARVVSRGSSFFDRLQSSLGGRTRRTLLLAVKNTAQTSASGVTVTAAIARDPQGGEPLQPPNVGTLGPGEARRFEVRVELPVPAFGSYVVFGTVYGGGAPVNFSATTSTFPWALIVVVVLLVLDVGAVVALRRRRRPRFEPLRPAQPNESARQTEGEHTSGQASRLASGTEGTGIVPSDALADG